ncbi:amine acid ABC transporter, permease protein, 3-TM region, His/Glu/Gln/Arg/opine family [Atopostipes suicloacalis DSM 15692]|uniref:Amine acid ABC transporter, permease protein, 3-TM region, His/Glu/Gln/Arg/opine family n=1 Tax=Atopostipes suicloacalis DSM 15692 TaxID=1121025 RepID=A0A1M4WNF6_9LACT|nr:ABC transporter substrate-binding protein/permease [Atopostipes suicloacalis]SHE82779.1 amine acid ABC transporter, permease protein, 3-TM region, His/Glu/Gln/Arg/opine family [Atopostipes suicloacalis DSM 15692]
MKRKSILFLALLSLLLGLSRFQTRPVEASNQEKEVVTIGISAQSKSYNYYDEENELAGFEIDLFKAIEQELDNYKFEYEITEFASLFAGVDSGKFDLIVNNIGENSERREKYLFSKNPYVITHNVLITRPDTGEDVTLEEMAGQTIGLVAGSLQAIFMEKYNEENLDQTIQLEYIDTDGANIIREVASGRYDMTIYSTTYLQDVIETFGLDLVGHPIENEDEIQPPGAYFLYNKNPKSLELRNAIDQAVERLREEGTLAEISEQHFGQDDTELTEEMIEKNEMIDQEVLSQMGETEEVQKVVVGTSGQTKPLNYFDDNNNLVGLEIDILEEMNRRLDTIDITYEITEFASLFAGLDSGKFDLVANNLGENEERREKFLFSLYPYVITHNVIITNMDQEPDLQIKDLAGKSFGVVPASPQSMFLESWNEENPDLAVDIQYIDSDPSTIIRDVHSGRFDATIYNTTYLHDVQETFGIELLAHPIEDEDAIRPPGSYFIYRPEDEALRDLMDSALADMREDGTLAEISHKYLGSDDTALTQEMIDKNDAIEAERLQVAQVTTEDTKKSSDGKIFAPKMILKMLPTILKKLPITVLMTIVAAIIGVTLGFIIAVIKINEVPILTQIFNVFVSFMRGTPQLVQLFLAFYGFPLIVQWLNERFGWTVDVNGIPALLYVFVAFGLNEAAYNSETFRAAILSVDPKEIEAAKSIGLTDRQTMRRIILPSALIVAIPNLGNSLISLLKGTSLAFTVTVIDIMGQARILAGANLRFFEAYIAVALFYWVFCILIEQGVRYLERKLNIADRPLQTQDSLTDVEHS